MRSREHQTSTLNEWQLIILERIKTFWRKCLLCDKFSTSWKIFKALNLNSLSLIGWYVCVQRLICRAFSQNRTRLRKVYRISNYLSLRRYPYSMISYVIIHRSKTKNKFVLEKQHMWLVCFANLSWFLFFPSSALNHLSTSWQLITLSASRLQ